MRKYLMILMAITAISFPSWSRDEKLNVKVLYTGTISPPEAETIKGGSWFKKFSMVHPAFFIQHPKGTFLFDTGLGHSIKTQVKDMVWWARSATKFIQKESAADQLKALGLKADRIILSHAHFDHSSGLIDFPAVPVEVLQEELDFLKTKNASPAIFPSLFNEQIVWQTYTLENKSYEGYAKSRDIFGDGSLILVGMPGHSPGSVGLFINLASGKRAFLVGDTVWNSDGVTKGLPKFWISSKFADNKPDEVMTRILELQALQKKYPDLLIVPSHDAKAVGAFEEMMNRN
ncbi:MBL fold metallo-hydrolase [Bdellovibrio bacteriovorus]|uniref:MBL fold metallo-hydrolase n=1 Tax=Bdellovibrio bacteriovorus TaxID=959 RepID=UPI003AA87FAF